MSGAERKEPISFHIDLPSDSLDDEVPQAPADVDVDLSAVVASPSSVESNSFELPTKGMFLVLTPGEDVQLVKGYHHLGSHLVALSQTGLTMRNGLRTYHLRIPGSPGVSGKSTRLVKGLVSVHVHRREIGPSSEPLKFVYAVDADDRLLGTVDVSDTWSLRTDRLAEMCAAARIDHRIELYADVEELVVARPEWAAPELEFEVNHPGEEATREWAEGIYLGAGLAILLGGTGTFLLSPLGPWFKAAIAGFCLISLVLTGWAMSRRRMRRSLSKAASLRDTQPGA